MATTCLNCGAEVKKQVLSGLREKTTVDRLTWHHLPEETVYFFTHTEGGFLRTTKELIITPGI